MRINIRPDCCIALRMIALQSWYASEQELWESWMPDVLDITEQLQSMINATTDGSVIITGMKASEEIIRLRAENEKLRAALAAEREKCYLAAVSTTCSVKETADYYSGYCDGVQDAAAVIREGSND